MVGFQSDLHPTACSSASGCTFLAIGHLLTLMPESQRRWGPLQDDGSFTCHTGERPPLSRRAESETDLAEILSVLTPQMHCYSLCE